MNRREVERLSGGRLGDLYVARMMWNGVENFEREIYAVGAGKDGIVVLCNQKSFSNAETFFPQ